MMAETQQYEAQATDGSGMIIRFTAPKDATPEQLNIIAERLFEMERKAKQPGTPPAREPGVPQAAPPMAAPMEPPPPEMPAPASGMPDMGDLEQRMNQAQKEQDVRMGQIIGGGAGLALGTGKAGLDVSRSALQGIGRNIAQGAATPQAPQGGTSGEKWARNWAGQERPGIGGVPEASAAYQRSKGQGKVSGRMSKMWGPAGPNEPAALVDRLMARGAPPPRPSGLERVTSVFQSMIGPASLGARYALPPLALAAAGGEGIRAKQMYEEGDTTGATLAGLSALGAVGSLTPLAPIAAPIGMGAGAMQYMRSRLEPDQKELSYEEMAEASQPSFATPAGRQAVMRRMPRP